MKLVGSKQLAQVQDITSNGMYNSSVHLVIETVYCWLLSSEKQVLSSVLQRNYVDWHGSLQIPTVHSMENTDLK
jgi:hypothetical protein